MFNKVTTINVKNSSGYRSKFIKNLSQYISLSPVRYCCYSTFMSLNGSSCDFMAFRFINLQNLINSHLKDSSPIGLDVRIKLWKILKQCKKVYGFYRDKLYQNKESFNDATPGFQCRRCN